MVFSIENRDHNHHCKGFTVIKWYQTVWLVLFTQQMLMKSQALVSNTISQNRLGYVAVTNNPRISLTLLFR